MSITKVKRAKRLELLNLQTSIEQMNCFNCESKYSNDDCDECPFFLQLKDIGQELLNLSTSEKSSEPSKDSALRPGRNYKPVTQFITLELYYEHKNKGLKDKQIADLLGVNQSTFRNWKQRNILNKYHEVKS